MPRKMLLALGIAILVLANAVQAWAWPLFPERSPAKADVVVIMYHLVTKNPKYQGKFGISPEELEADFIYLKENGYNTILMEDLINFADRKRPLPKKPVLLTFDDGRFSDHLYVLPLLEKYKTKAVFSVIGTETDENSDKSGNKKPHMGWEQVAELAASKYTEVQNHSYNLHGDNGSAKLRSESLEKYQARFGADTSKQQELTLKNTGSTPTTYTYPLGIISKGSQEVLEGLGMRSSLSCVEGINHIVQGEPLFMLRRNNREHGKPVGEILRKLESKQHG